MHRHVGDRQVLVDFVCRYVGKIPKRSWMNFMKCVLKMEPRDRLDGAQAVAHPMYFLIWAYYTYIYRK